MQASQTPRKPRAKRSVPVAELLQAISRSKETARQDPAGALAFLSGWLKADYPELSAELRKLADL